MPQSEITSLSGLQANQHKNSVTAHNLANRTTDGFERQRVQLRETASGGVQSRIDTVELSKEAREISVGGPQNNINTVDEIVNQIDAKHGFKSNVQAIRASDRMMKSLLDTLA